MELKNNYIVDVVAPSSAGNDPSHLDLAIKHYTNLGYKIHYPENMLDFSNTFHANTDEFRSKTLVDALLNSESNIVWCWKGGYGASKLIPDLLKISKPKHEKFFIGFSDITALHIFLNQHWGWKTIHGASFSNPVRKEFDPKNSQYVLNIIDGKTKKIIIDDLKMLSGSGDVSGIITGGNLSMIEQSIGTAWQVDMTDKIVILEDVDERGYRVDRMLDHLLQAGILNKAKAVVFGQFTGSKEKDNSDHVPIAIEQFCKKVSYPVYRINSIGHDYQNIPFVYGSNGTVIASTLEMSW
jgi:muramoyltetrapeptide carboxypeptidase